MSLPRIIITGASGFIGRHLLEGLKEHFIIYGLARRSQLRCAAPFHENITWFQVDIGDKDTLGTVFRQIRSRGGADIVIHLAAHYDFTGEEHPEYWRTNVHGLRNVLDECQDLALRKFLFASSVAACSFPRAGEALTERSPPDGEHIYAVTKRAGERMLSEYAQSVPSCIVRFAALFSDWCEYPPLYFFFETWLSNAWNSRILGGKGESAIPYLHVREMVPFFRQVIDRLDTLEPQEVLIASPSETMNHKDLFDLACINHLGHRRRAVFMPTPLCRLGVWGRDLLGRILGSRPFERPWMVRYIDYDLAVDANHTYQRLDWQPRDRLRLYRRIPFMMEHRKTDPVEWHRRNRAALKEVKLRANLRVHRLLEKNHEEIERRYLAAILGPDGKRVYPSYQRVPQEILEWRFKVALRNLLNAVRTGDRGVFTDFCRDLALKRYKDGFDGLEVCNALELLNDICIRVLKADPECDGVAMRLHEILTMTVQFGCDQILGIYEELGEAVSETEVSASPVILPGGPPAP